jgi:hypothetical protein
MHVEDPGRGPKTSSRVIAAAVALGVVVAVAVFLIPALRLKDGNEPGGSSEIIPLWPTQTQDGLRSLQAQADAGEDEWALDPVLVAQRFGAEVMGWDRTEVSPATSETCGAQAQWFDGGDMWSTPPATTTPSCFPPMTPAEDPVDVSHSTPIVGAFPVVYLMQCSSDLCVGAGQLLELYQPLDQGLHEIWAVRAAYSRVLGLSVAPGQAVHTGATVSGSLPDAAQGQSVALGYASCGASGASSSVDESDQSGMMMSVDISALPNDCSGDQPGYAWLGLREGSETGADPIGDPFGESDEHLTLLTAAPIVVTSP